MHRGMRSVGRAREVFSEEERPALQSAGRADRCSSWLGRLGLRLRKGVPKASATAGNGGRAQLPPQEQERGAGWWDEVRQVSSTGVTSGRGLGSHPEAGSYAVFAAQASVLLSQFSQSLSRV